MKQENATPSTQAESVEALELDSVYANNTAFESSVWDLKIVFGQLELHTGKPGIEWHTEVTIPWLQAKILAYYLRVNITLHELQNGPVKVPSPVLPPKPAPPADENDLAEKEAYEAVLKIHTECFG
jgi:hypothetical protein